MARLKNAIREHYVADYEEGEDAPKMDDFMLLAKWIQTITDETEDQTEEEGDYAGDGTLRTEVSGVSERWTVEGAYDSSDDAQELIVGKKRKPNKRKVWHLIKQTNGENFLGVATATDIVGGSGDATEHEDFGCTLNYDEIPEEVDEDDLEPIPEG